MHLDNGAVRSLLRFSSVVSSAAPAQHLPVLSPPNALLTARLLELPSTATGTPCDVCGTYFSSYISMVVHRRKHNEAAPLPRQTTVDVYAHALDGMPQCKHCLATL